MDKFDLSEQITNHNGAWVRLETAQSMQARIDELTAEVAELRKPVKEIAETHDA